MSEETKELEVQDKDVIIAKIVLKGDLSALKPREKVQYYNELCHALGLNPLTRPFDYIRMQGKEILYANKSATEQLRKRDNISVFDKTIDKLDDIYIVTVKVRNGEGREDIGSGALKIEGLSGDDLANALMKAETKAKRRATLSICGLGMIDETEIETTSATFVTDEELDKAKATILQVLEDNCPMYLEEAYKESVIDEIDYAVSHRDITGLETTYVEVKKVLSKAMNPEIKDMTDLGFKKAAQMYAEKQSTVSEETEPDIPDSDGELDIF